MENEKDMGTVVSDYAIENFKNGLNCAESVMDALVRSGALKDSPEAVHRLWRRDRPGRLYLWGAVRRSHGQQCGLRSAGTLEG